MAGESDKRFLLLSTLNRFADVFKAKINGASGKKQRARLPGRGDTSAFVVTLLHPRPRRQPLLPQPDARASVAVNRCPHPAYLLQHILSRP